MIGLQLLISFSPTSIFGTKTVRFVFSTGGTLLVNIIPLKRTASVAVGIFLILKISISSRLGDYGLVLLMKAWISSQVIGV